MTETAIHSLADLLSAWRSDPIVRSNIVEWRTLPARPAQFVPFPDELHPALAEWLATRGIAALYSHQATAWLRVQAGKHVVVVTGTASGKTLCYNLPVLDRLLRDPAARALYLFPTKALAQDQVANLSPYPVAAYDGDTPADARAGIRAKARIVVSNPDMIHTGVLPHHTLWAEFFRHLQFVVVDEMHAYRGLFGSQVANVLRRLKRVARFYGAAPQFILTSATIANPAELAERLIEEPVVVVDDDGAAKGAKHILIYNPPVVDESLGLRRSALLESVRLAQGLLDYDIQTILFARARRTVEVILRYLTSSHPHSPTPRWGDHDAPPGGTYTDAPSGGAGRVGVGGEAGEAVRGYRSGYLPSERREIERGLRSGAVRAVVATNALELGVDIGGMGAAILVGYPGTIAGTWQQVGRAGRGANASVAVLVASADPLDQFLAKHPDYFFGRSPERALVNPDNLLVLLQHVRCAAFEIPFQEGEGFGRVPAAQLGEYLEFLREASVIHRSGTKYFWMADQYPADAVSLRSASADTVVLQSNGRTIGEIDRASADRMVHTQAIYLHQGESFLVQEYDPDKGIAQLQPVDADYYTEPRGKTTVQLLDRLAEAEARGATKAHGEIAVTTIVTGFRKVKWYTHENLGDGLVSLPPSELHTTGYWLGLHPETVETLRALGLWTNAPNDYGPDWVAIRARVRARDGYRCQGCGVHEAGMEHHVHHRIPFRTFASHKQANQLDNLVTLCPICHRRAETAVRLRSGLSGLAHVLGHLAPLFLMCDAHDIGIHSDPESPLADGRPAVVIYDGIPAGIGLSERLFELHDEMVARALELVTACGCSDGCPSCVGPGGENGYGGKRETEALLQVLAGEGPVSSNQSPVDSRQSTDRTENLAKAD